MLQLPLQLLELAHGRDGLVRLARDAEGDRVALRDGDGAAEVVADVVGPRAPVDVHEAPELAPLAALHGRLERVREAAPHEVVRGLAQLAAAAELHGPQRARLVELVEQLLELLPRAGGRARHVALLGERAVRAVVRDGLGLAVRRGARGVLGDGRRRVAGAGVAGRAREPEHLLGRHDAPQLVHLEVAPRLLGLGRAVEAHRLLDGAAGFEAVGRVDASQFARRLLLEELVQRRGREGDALEVGRRQVHVELAHLLCTRARRGDGDERGTRALFGPG
mmetsp:Transcript_21931/g.65756  ORF Transcript_21931/g.65756 Transcript_21931/m.65756 type:complete len:278 (-) Transcript_21931:261-1094(-)